MTTANFSDPFRCFFGALLPAAPRATASGWDARVSAAWTDVSGFGTRLPGMVVIIAASCFQRQRVVCEIPVSLEIVAALTGFGPIIRAKVRALIVVEYSTIRPHYLLLRFL
jgi:hypothetical protein